MIRLEQIDWPSRRRWSHSNRCTTCNSNTRPPRRAGQWRNIRWLSSLTSNSSSMSMASWMSPLGTLISITLLKLPSPNPRIPLILFWLNLTPYLCKSHWCISCWPLFFLSPTVSTSPIIYKSSGRKHLFYVSLFYKKKKKKKPLPFALSCESFWGCMDLRWDGKSQSLFSPLISATLSPDQSRL